MSIDDIVEILDFIQTAASCIFSILLLLVGSVALIYIVIKLLC